MQAKPLVNRVAASGLKTIDLETFAPTISREIFDLKDHLFHGLVLREKDFRAALAAHDWDQYLGKDVIITCSADAIIPMWAPMLVAIYLAPKAVCVFQGTEREFLREHYRVEILKMDTEPYQNQRVVVKGCGEEAVPANAYAQLAAWLQPVVKSLMFGEPCSTVPLYKRPKSQG